MMKRASYFFVFVIVFAKRGYEGTKRFPAAKIQTAVSYSKIKYEKTRSRFKRCRTAGKYLKKRILQFAN